MNKFILIGGGIAGIAALAKLAGATPEPIPPPTPEPTANITAVLPFLIDRTSCSGSCLVTATVTWKNTGDAAGTFRPTVRAGNLMAQNTEETLAPGQEVTRQFQFYLAQTTELCPEPN